MENQTDYPLPVFPEEVKRPEVLPEIKIKQESGLSLFVFVFVSILCFSLTVVGLWFLVIDKKFDIANKFGLGKNPAPTVKMTIPTASWKTYKNQDVNFKYPSDWKLDSTNKISSISGVNIIIIPSNSTAMNECMKNDETKIVNDLTIKNFSRVNSGEMCQGGDLTQKESWIVKKDGNGYAPGIQYQYKTSADGFAEKIFSQILSTFRFAENK